MLSHYFGFRFLHDCFTYVCACVCIVIMPDHMNDSYTTCICVCYVRTYMHSVSINIRWLNSLLLLTNNLWLIIATANCNCFAVYVSWYTGM